MKKKYLALIILIAVMFLTLLAMNLFPAFEEWLHQLIGWY